jgi:two-component system sensor histidine kinase KdpD
MAGVRKMNRKKLFDGIITVGILIAMFGVNLMMQQLFATNTMTPMIFVLGVFLVSWLTQGYFWGITASLVSVLAVNYAFTYPYWAFDLITPECVSSAVVMLIVAIMTGTLTTKLKQQEKMKAEAEKERMRGNLLRAVSHDLRTPLTSIYGACSTIIENYDELPREKQLKLLGDVRSDAQWLVRMVENLLSITRLDDAKVRLNKNDTVLEELIDAVLVKFRKHYPLQNVQAELPEEFISIPMDAMLIEQVLMNLLENAVFHAKDMRNLWLQAQLQGRKVRFVVADDGCGIPEERLKNILSGSLDSEAPRDTGRSNMGIGLSVCSAIVRAHGGTVSVRNRPEGGAEFSFTLEMEEMQNGEQ